MPIFIPFLLGGISLLVGGVGVMAGADGISDMKRAKRIGEDAQERYQNQVASLKASQESTNDKAAAYGKKKIEIRANTLSRIVKVLEQIGQRSSHQFIESILGVNVTHNVIDDFKAQYLEAESVLKGIAMAGSSAALAGPAAFAAAGLLGVASTGTAISSLSGAAATSATFAWFGGGSLAAGGFGMAGGTLVLGGIVAAPALFVGGFVLASQGEKAVSKALEYEAKVDTEIAQMNVSIEALKRIDTRINELDIVVTGLNTRVKEALSPLEAIATHFNAMNSSHVVMLQKTMILAKGLSEAMQIPVIGNDGLVHKGSEQAIEKYQRM